MSESNKLETNTMVHVRAGGYTGCHYDGGLDADSWSRSKTVCSCPKDNCNTEHEETDSSTSSNDNFFSESAAKMEEFPLNLVGITIALQKKDFKMAVQVLLQMYRTLPGSMLMEELKVFVDHYCEKVIHNQSLSKSQTSGPFAGLDLLLCPICFGVLTDPVTAQCGHSYCRKCLQKEAAGQSCRRCKYTFSAVDVNQSKLNVMLGFLLSKWWASHLKAAALRNEGNTVFEAKSDVALAKYTEALNLVPEDHLTLGNRSHVLFSSLGKSEEALTDIDAAIKLCPLWAKGYFRKASVLISLGRYEEAFVNLSLCIFLVKAAKSADEIVSNSVKAQMVTVLHKIFSQATGGYFGPSRRSASLDQRQYPYPKMNSSQSKEGLEGAADEDESEYNSSGDEAHGQHSDSKLVMGKVSRKKYIAGISSSVPSSHAHTPKKNSHFSDSQSTVATHLTRVLKLFERTSQDIKKLQVDWIDAKPSKTADVNRIPKLTRPSDSSVISVNDIECTLCYRLLHQPVTTLCGHTYCRSCLERSLDHSPACPLCKTPLDEYLALRRHAVTHFLEVAIEQLLPEEYAERVQQHKEEFEQIINTENSSSFEIPIFVCTMAFPTIPCPLHVFEPRYRLMIRRAVESGSQSFGMCCYVHDGDQNYAEYGTLLQIRNVQYFADGRSVVDTIGKCRFKILRKSQKDGYNTARVEILRDRPIDAEERPRLEEIHNQVYSEAKTWLDSINQVLRQRIHAHFGQMPQPEDNWIESSEGPAWSWWLLAILPLDTKAQLAILSMNSLQKRLESIRKVLRHVKSSQM